MSIRATSITIQTYHHILRRVVPGAQMWCTKLVVMAGNPMHNYTVDVRMLFLPGGAMLSNGKTSSVSVLAYGGPRKRVGGLEYLTIESTHEGFPLYLAAVRDLLYGDYAKPALRELF